MLDAGDIIKPCVAIVGLVGCYFIYMYCGPGGDGIIFGTLAAAIAGLGGFMLKDIIGRQKTKKLARMAAENFKDSEATVNGK